MSSPLSSSTLTPPPRRRPPPTDLALPRPPRLQAQPFPLDLADISSTTAGPSRPARRANDAEPIDLTLDDSDDEPVVVAPPVRHAAAQGATGRGTNSNTSGMFHPRRLARPRVESEVDQRGNRRLGSEEAREHIQAIDRTLARRAEQARAIVEQEAGNGDNDRDRRRGAREQLNSLVPLGRHAERPADRPAIGFGGAVQRRGDQRVHFIPAPRREPPRPPRPFRQLVFEDDDIGSDDDDYVPPEDDDQMEEGRAATFAARRQRRAAAAAQPQPPMYPDRRAAIDADVYRQAMLRPGEMDENDDRAAARRALDQAAEVIRDHDDNRPQLEQAGFGAGFRGFMARLDRMFPRFHNGNNLNEAMGYRDDLGMGGAAAGPGPGRNALQDLETLLSQIQCPKSPEPLKGFESSFDLQASVPIVIDAEDDTPPRELFFECPVCEDPLRVSSGYRSADDRVWVMRCGHMIDQKCLHKLATPFTPEQIKNVISLSGEAGFLPVLGEETSPPAKKKRRTNKKSTGPIIHVWRCPIEGCGVIHTSQRRELDLGEEDVMGNEVKWVQTEEGGAIAAYM